MTLRCCDEEDVTNLAKELNIGPTMFLMTVKQLIKFFIFLSFLNIPCYLFYFQSNNRAASRDLVAIFGALSLGNIGEQGDVCSSMNYAAAN